MLGVMRSRNSTTVTSAPSRRHTDPSSSPITPPPMTAIFAGTVFSASAPVLSTMRPAALSTGHGGIGVGSLPVAMMMCLPRSERSPTRTSPRTDVSAPAPLTYSTLFFFSRCSMPPVSPRTCGARAGRVRVVDARVEQERGRAHAAAGGKKQHSNPPTWTWRPSSRRGPASGPLRPSGRAPRTRGWRAHRGATSAAAPWTGCSPRSSTCRPACRATRRTPSARVAAGGRRATGGARRPRVWRAGQRAAAGPRRRNGRARTLRPSCPALIAAT